MGPRSNLEALFKPKSVAVIGASRKPEKLGYRVLKNIVDAGFRGEIYPINPGAEEILGLEAYPSIEDVLESVDLAVIIIPSRFVPETLRQCIKKGVKGAVIISGGFREVGDEGAKLEKEVIRIAREGRIKFIGPNCQGINNPSIGLCASWPLIKDTGTLAVVSQSGTIFATMEMWASADRVGISKAAAIGNKADVDEADLIGYLASDDETSAIAVYTEGVRDGRRLMEALRAASRVKPVVTLKSGRTEAGAKAVFSHTGALAGRDEVYDAAFRQSRVVRARDLEKFYDVSKAFSLLKPPKGKRILIITSSGGSGILASDRCEDYGLELAGLSEGTKATLSEELPYFCIIGNPLDLTGSAYAELYEKTLAATVKDENVDCFLLIFGDPIPGAADSTAPIIRSTEKTVLVTYLGGGEIQQTETDEFQRLGVPVFPTPEREVTALTALIKFRKN